MHLVCAVGLGHFNANTLYRVRFHTKHLVICPPNAYYHLVYILIYPVSKLAF